MNAQLTRRNLLRAFRPASDDDSSVQRLAQIGAACVEPRGVVCRRCGEACDAGAIRYRPIRGGAEVLLSIEACTGCGDCVPVCPVGAIAMAAADRALVAAGLAQAGVKA